MAKAFQKFIGQQETGAKKKERLRQEKKQARKETQEYFAKKKAERYQQRAAEKQQEAGGGSFGKKDGKRGKEDAGFEGKRGTKSFGGKHGAKGYEKKRSARGFEGKRDAKNFEGNRGERKGGFAEKRGGASGFVKRGEANSGYKTNQDPRSKQSGKRFSKSDEAPGFSGRKKFHGDQTDEQRAAKQAFGHSDAEKNYHQRSSGEESSYFDRKKSSGKSGAKGSSRIQTGQTGSDIGATFKRKPSATKQTTTYNRNTNSRGSNENAADGHSKAFGKSAGTDKHNKTNAGAFSRSNYADKPGTGKQSSTSKSVAGKQSSTNAGASKQGKTNADAGTAADNSKASSASMPLNKFIAHAGICSRRDAAEMVKAGKVTVNGELATEPGFKVSGKDQIKVNGKLIAVRRNLVYILLNKPKDFITTTEDPQGRKTVLDIIKHATTERVYPVGRLDRNTTGVLLLTNDGELAQKLSHPSYEIKKIYEVTLDKPLVKKDFDALLNGITLEDGFIAPDVLAYADNKDKSVIGIEIHSGRNRIVRRIFEHLGYDVRNLDRVMYANLTKKNVERGKWRFLSEKEVRLLKYLNASYTKNKPARRG